MKSILNKDFEYVPSHNTDIRKTFERIRAKQREAKAKKQREAKAKERQKNADRIDGYDHDNLGESPDY